MLLHSQSKSHWSAIISPRFQYFKLYLPNIIRFKWLYTKNSSGLKSLVFWDNCVYMVIFELFMGGQGIKGVRVLLDIRLFWFVLPAICFFWQRTNFQMLHDLNDSWSVHRLFIHHSMHNFSFFLLNLAIKWFRRIINDIHNGLHARPSLKRVPFIIGFKQDDSQ